jgi:hypothetical protein
MEGVDAYFMEEGFYDNVKDAMADSEGTLYLDLSLQSPVSSLQSPVSKVPANSRRSIPTQKLEAFRVGL